MAVFCLQLNTALQARIQPKWGKHDGNCNYLVQVLDRGASGAKSTEAAAYNLVAISLSGFASSGEGLWKRMVRSHQSQIEDAYLRAAFLFLTADEAEEESYKAILALGGLELSDKVHESVLHTHGWAPDLGWLNFDFVVPLLSDSAWAGGNLETV